MENKILTAEEFINKNSLVFLANPTKILKEFAKLHVQRAIEECIESAPSGSSTDTVSYEDVVKALKDCYPLNLIK